MLMSLLHQLVREAQPEPAPAPTPKAQPRPDPARRERPPLGEPRAFTPFFGCCGEAHEGFPRAPEKWCTGGGDQHHRSDQHAHVRGICMNGTVMRVAGKLVRKCPLTAR